MQTPRHDTIEANGALVSRRNDADDRVMLIERIDEILPQTQCQQCGYDGCKPYAAAIVQGRAQINQCPPGGDAGIHALVNLLEVPYLPLNTDHGLTKPKLIAIIDEQRCIGCTLCIQACPVDAILGASKHMHTVISQECTGCELCLAPCPVDCIIMEPAIPMGAPIPDMIKSKAAANLARTRHQHRQARLIREKHERAQTYANKKQVASTSVENLSTKPDGTGGTANTGSNADAVKKAAIAAAMARVNALKMAATKQPDKGT
ncbi:MAG TPA: electron transport complex subunit RsxB [Methylophilus sp.]|nr:electron transport complex subunit RsxB [Methylophilus sp.]